MRKEKEQGKMICQYREKRYLCGDFLEVDIFPVFKKGGQRAKKAKPTTETQKQLNAKNAERRLIRLLNTNFTSADIKCELTYAPGNEPQSDKEAEKDLTNFLRRMKRLRGKKGLDELRYVVTIEKGEKSGRFHHHVIASGGLFPNEIASLWGLGYVQKLQPLQFDENGIAGLGFYFCGQKRGRKIDPIGYRRYRASRNLKQPTELPTRDGRISQRRIRDIAAYDLDAKTEFEKLYDGFFFSGYELQENAVNRGVYISLRMRRKDRLLDIWQRKRRGGS